MGLDAVLIADERIREKIGLTGGYIGQEIDAVVSSRTSFSFRLSVLLINDERVFDR